MTLIETQRAYGLLHLRAAFEPGSRRWEMAVYMRNLSNREYITVPQTFQYLRSQAVPAIRATGARSSQSAIERPPLFFFLSLKKSPTRSAPT